MAPSRTLSRCGSSARWRGRNWTSPEDAAEMVDDRGPEVEEIIEEVRSSPRASTAL